MRRHTTYAVMSVAMIGMVSACSYTPQTIDVKGADSKSLGKAYAYVIHVPAGSGDKDDIQNIEFKDEHYGIVISPIPDKPESFSSLNQVSAVALKSYKSNQILTDSLYMCDAEVSDVGRFGCRLSAAAGKDNQYVYINLHMKDGSKLTTELINVSKADDYKPDEWNIIALPTVGKPQDFTLKLCPLDGDGKQAEVPVSKACSCPTNTTYNASTNTCSAASTGTPSGNDCPPPNFLDPSGKCVSVLQPNPKTGACPGDQVVQLDGSCGTSCGANQVQKLNTCECAVGFQKDGKGTTCVKPENNLNAEVASPTSGGGSCSLIRSSF